MHHKASRFLECIKDCFLYQHDKEATHYRGSQQANTLDLIFTNEEDIVKSIEIKSPLGRSHNCGLAISFNCYQQNGPLNSNKPLYEKGNYVEMRKDLQSVIWKTELKGKNTEDAFSFIKDRIENVIKKHLTTRKVQGSKR